MTLQTTCVAISYMEAIRLVRYFQWTKSRITWNPIYGITWRHSTSYGHGPLTRYAELQIAHAQRKPLVNHPAKEIASKPTRYASQHVRHARDMMHVGIANPRWRGKRFRHPRRMRNPQLYISSKRPMGNYFRFIHMPLCVNVYSRLILHHYSNSRFQSHPHVMIWSDSCDICFADFNQRRHEIILDKPFRGNKCIANW